MPDVTGRPRPPSSARAAWGAIVGFWLLYFLVIATRDLAAGRPHSFALISRTATVAVLMMGLAWLCHVALARSSGSIHRSVIVAAIIAAPAALAFAMTDGVVSALHHGEGGWSMSPIWSWGCGRRLDTAVKAVSHFDRRRCGDGAETMLQVIYNTSIGYFLFVAWSALYLALSYSGEVRALERRAAELRAAAQLSELRALRYQINPHFLFNTLNSLSTLVMTGRNTGAERMIANLSTFFRTSLVGDPTHDVTLEEEIALQKLYLDIEAVRFPDRLISDVVTPAGLATTQVPGLILQPLVENAVKHGVSTTLRPVTIAVRAEAVGSTLRLSVEDDGTGAEDAVEGVGLGLRNVRDRLAARYGERAGCAWGRTPSGGFRVELTIPAARYGG